MKNWLSTTNRPSLILAAGSNYLLRSVLAPSILWSSPSLARSAPFGINSRTSFLGSRIPFSTTSDSSNSAMSVLSSDESTRVWSYDDPEAFASQSHPGYTLESNASTFTGGWLAHRQALQSVDGSKPKDWIQEEVADMITKFDYDQLPIGRAPRILVLYGSLRESSFSRKLAYEFARLLELLGCDIRVYNPRGLPVRDPALENHIKVQELRALTLWSDGHVWVSPEMHGTITGVFKNQIDWIPLNTGSIRPTQGRTCLVAQVNGGSQSFNAVNFLRLLARWVSVVLWFGELYLFLSDLHLYADFPLFLAPFECPKTDAYALLYKPKFRCQGVERV